MPVTRILGEVGIAGMGAAGAVLLQLFSGLAWLQFL